MLHPTNRNIWDYIFYTITHFIILISEQKLYFTVRAHDNISCLISQERRKKKNNSRTIIFSRTKFYKKYKYFLWYMRVFREDEYRHIKLRKHVYSLSSLFCIIIVIVYYFTKSNVFVFFCKYSHYLGVLRQSLSIKTWL